MFIYTNQKYNSKRKHKFRLIFKVMMTMTVFSVLMVVLIARYPHFVKSVLTFRY